MRLSRFMLWQILRTICFVSFVAFFIHSAIAQTRTGYSPIIASNSGKCLNVYAGSTNAGAAIIQYTCVGTGNQQWTLQPYGGAFRIVVKHTGMCLSVTGDSSQSNVATIQYPCGSYTNQLWTPTGSGNAVQLISKQTNMCLAIQNGGLGDAAALVQQGCQGGSNEFFTFASGLVAANSTATLVARHSGQCLGIPGGAASGSPAQQSSCSGTGAQQWKFVLLGNAFQIVSNPSGLCMALANSGGGAGTAVVQLACSGTASMKWTLQSSNNHYQIVSQQSGLCLNIQGGSLSEGAAAVQSACQNTNSQLWSLGKPAVPIAWSSVISLPIVPVAAANLTNGQVLTWAAYSPINYAFGIDNGQTATAIFNPATQTSQARQVTETGHDMFCPGNVMLPDGRVLVNGGSSNRKTSIYNSANNTWQSGALLNIGRGYQGSVTLSNGSVLSLGGSWSGQQGGKIGEVWTAASGWTLKSGIPIDPFLGPDPEGVFRADNHLWLFAQSNGKVFHAGPSANMNWIDTNGSGSVSSAGTRGDDAYSMNGNAAMFDIGKILKVGGAPAYEEAWATPNAYVIDINGTATTRKVAPMAYARSFSNSVVLPNGQVLISGGQAYAKLFSDDLSVLVPELWDPATESYSKLSPMQVPRNYHSFSLLLPDGRVLIGGGGLCGSCTTNHANVEIVTPPYLLNADGTPATRPVIWGGSASAAAGGTLTIGVTMPVSSFALMRLSSVTHSLNTDQRRIPLPAWTQDANVYSLQVPSDYGVVTPGYYMLFAISPLGVPSVAKIVQIL